MAINNPFENRVLSSFPLSIPTGLALEAVFEPIMDRYDDTKKINKINIDNYKYHFFNVYTLIRNIFNAVTTVKNKDTLYYSKHLAQTVIDEIEMIKSLYLEKKCKPIFYFPDYVTVIRNLNHDKSSHSYYGDLVKIDKYVKRSILTLNNGLSLDFKFPRTNEKCLITTHLSVDLLNVKSINNLDLLESHTGALKTPSDYNNKYHPIGKKPMEVFPFIEELYFLLGDKTIIKPSMLSLRLELFELAMEEKWNYRTTKERVLTSIRNKNLKCYDLVKNYKTIY